MADSQPDAPARPVSLKVPPHSLEAEQSVLGGLMLNNEAWFGVYELVSETDFYRGGHRVIFQVMTELSEANQPLDAVTLAEGLSSRGLLEKAGGLAYIGELAENTPGAGNVLAYARIVRERSTLRQLITAANTIAENAFAPQGAPATRSLTLRSRRCFALPRDA